MPESATAEQIKLVATAFNNLAVSMVTVGVFGPIVALVYDFQRTALASTILWRLPIICVCAALILHLIGQLFLLFLEKIDGA